MFSDRCVPKCIWSNCSWCTHWNQVSVDQQGRQLLLLTFMSMLNRCLVLSYRLLPIFFFIWFYQNAPGYFFHGIIHINGPFTGLHICRYWAATTYWSLLMSLFTVSAISPDLLMCHCQLDSVRFSPLQKVAFLEMLSLAGGTKCECHFWSSKYVKIPHLRLTILATGQLLLFSLLCQYCAFIFI